MKILVKESDRLRGTIKPDTIISEYLIYLMVDDNTPVECHIAYGEDERDTWLNIIQATHAVSKDLTIPIEHVSFGEFKEQMFWNNNFQTN